MPEPKTEVSDIVARRNQSRDWFNKNLRVELGDVLRAIKCRTKPVYKRNSAGQETNEEDRSRTNVCMPDLNIIFRRNVARMTAQPYRCKVIGGKDPYIGPALSALLAQQFDRSGEAWHDRRVTAMGEFAGFGYSKLFVNKITRRINARRPIMKGNQVVMRDRASIMQSQGAGDDEIADAVKQLGSDLTDDEVKQFMLKSGKEVTIPSDVVKYYGPCVKSLFIGDVFLEPGCLTLDDSNFVIEQYYETELWIKEQKDLTYEDESGNDVKVFDDAALAELLSANPDGRSDQRVDDLREYFEGQIGRQTEQLTQFPSKLRPRKRFDIIECHELADDGRIWITWVSELVKDKPLGKMPYPWDLDGKYVYTEYVPLPDLIGPHGDSTPRLLRYLHQMHNLTAAQNFDFVTNIMKKSLLADPEMKIEDCIDRGWFRIFRVENPGSVQYLQEPSLPSGALEREAQILQMMGLAEPSLMNVNAGTETNPMAGKTATTAIIASKSADALTKHKLDARDWYIRQVNQKKLAINQKIGEDKWKIEKQFWGEELNKIVGELPQEGQKPEWAFSDRNGKTVAILLDPYEIQEDFEIQPESGSYLSVDDDIRRTAAQNLAQAAQMAPTVFDQRKVARFYASTIPDIGNPDDYILPEPPPDSGIPPFKGNISVSIPLDKLASMPVDVVNQLLPMLGLQPSQELTNKANLQAVNDVAQAANSATDLVSLAEPQPKQVPAQ